MDVTPQEDKDSLSELDWQRLRSLAPATTVDAQRKMRLENLVSSVIQDMTKPRSNRSDDDQ